MVAEQKKQVKKSSKMVAREREGKMYDTLQSVGSLTREQIELLFYNGMTNKCQQRLKALYDRKKLQRGRCDVSDSYCYWLDKKPGKIDHVILCNWVYCQAHKEGIDIKAWVREYKTDYFVADAFSIFIVDGRYTPLFIEMQREINHSKFDKVEKYSDYFKSEEWAKKSWAKPIDGKIKFPHILVVTDGDTSKLENIIKEENRIGLRFIVVSLQDLNLRKCLQ